MGVAAVYALFNQRIVSEIILVDLNKEKAEGEAMDHGQLLVGNVKVRAQTYEDLEDSQVVVFTAGVGQKYPDESRLELLNRNASVFNDIIAELDKYAPDAILIISTNPVDILTYVEGVKHWVTPDLNDEEISGLENSAGVLKKNLSATELS